MAKNCTPNVAPNKQGTATGDGGRGAAADAAQLEKLCEIKDVLEDPVPIESAFAPIGCIVDEQGEIVGKVLACISEDEAGVKQVELVAVRSNQPLERNYTGPWVPCEGEEYTVTNSLVCYQPDPSTFVTLHAHYVYGPTFDSSMPSRTIFYTDGRNNIIDPIAGSVTPGACPVQEQTVTTNDEELLLFCDESGQTFLRRYTVIDDVVTTTDTEYDGVTPYAVQGEVSTDCVPISDAFDTESFCYVTTNNPEQRVGWARHQDSLFGVSAPHISPAGIAFFTDQGQPLNLQEPGFAIVPCSGPIQETPDEEGPQYTTTYQDIAPGNTLTIAPGTDLISWVVRNRSGDDNTLQVNGGQILILDRDEVAASGGIDEEGSTLTDTVILTAVSGSLRLMILRRV